MGQTFAAVGTADPRLNAIGKMDFRLTRVFSGWRKKDPAPARKKPIPKSVLLEATCNAHRRNDPSQSTIADLIWLAFFFLLRPSEYLHTDSDGHPFTLADVKFRVGSTIYDAALIPLPLIDQTSSVGLNFTQQKNGIKGEVVWLTATGEPDVCPVRSVARRVDHLRRRHASNNTPLYCFYDAGGTQRRVTDRDITRHLRFFAQCANETVDVTAGALRCTGASALLNAQVPKELIQLLGRWRSDEVFRYLHTQSTTLMQPFSRAMVSHVL